MMQAFSRIYRGILSIDRLQNSSLALSTRGISVGSDSAAYAGDGKTTVRMLNNADSPINFISAYSNRGFRLHNNLFINGSIILFPTHVFSWSVRRGKDINLDSLLLFDLIIPKVKIVIIGYGEADEEHDPTIPIKLKKKGISCEILATHNAVTTYNYLANDAVHVAGAFIPTRREITMTQADIIEMSNDIVRMETERPLIQNDLTSRVGWKEQKELYEKTTGREKHKDSFDD